MDSTGETKAFIQLESLRMKQETEKWIKKSEYAAVLDSTNSEEWKGNIPIGNYMCVTKTT